MYIVRNMILSIILVISILAVSYVVGSTCGTHYGEISARSMYHSSYFV